MHTTNDDVRFLKPIPQIWADVLTILSKTMSPGSFAVVKTCSELKFMSDGIAIIAVANPFSQGLISSYKTLLQDTLGKLAGCPVLIEFVIDSSVGSSEYSGTFASIPHGGDAGGTRTAKGPVVGGLHPTRQSDAAIQIDSSNFDEGVFDLEVPDVDVHDRWPKGDLVDAGEKPVQTLAQTKFDRESTIDFAPGIGQAAKFAAPPAIGRSHNKVATRHGRMAPDISRSGLNPKHTFATFVVGSNNRFCHSAAVAVSQSPGQNYNPLFVYGGVGLGKTHLMQAIGHAILEMTPNLQVRYLSCERFTNDLINSIKDKQMVDFRKRYRNIDVLLIDDIQFIEGKESTQEEFFHTFNTLRDAGKQLVISSDRPPKALSRLEERLRSRFEWGLISDIQAPDYETRLAILRKKCEQDGIRVDEHTLNHIATIFTSNIRELEGALIRVNAYANLTGQRVDQLSLHSLLTPNGTPETKPTLTVDEVIGTVAEHYKLMSAELKSSKRSQDLTLPRHIAMHLCHELLNLSFPRIGQAFGNRKHTSALYAHNKVKDMISADPNVASVVSKLRRQLGH